jgi:hypothetical protein
VRLVASGGVRSERYEFEYRIDASGNISTWLHDELRERHVEGQRKQEVRADPDAFRALVESIDVDALLREESPAAGFPPDSVVGRLEISDGEQSASFAFLADYQQASRAGRQANESLRRVVDAIYRSAAAHLDTEDLAP